MSKGERKGERTRRMIVEKAAEVFNVRGYYGTSMSDLVKETGLEKGGIYNYFDSKEELALAAFDHAAGLVLDRMRRAMTEPGRERATERLISTVAVYASLTEDRPIRGGCPILNTAIEADGSNPALRERAREAMSKWRSLIVRAAREGKEDGELVPQTDPEALASAMICAIEGAVMMSRLYNEPVHIHRVVEHLTQHLRALTCPKARKENR